MSTATKFDEPIKEWHINLFDPRHLINLMKEMGFELINVEGFGFQIHCLGLHVVQLPIRSRKWQLLLHRTAFYVFKLKNRGRKSEWLSVFFT